MIAFAAASIFGSSIQEGLVFGRVSDSFSGLKYLLDFIIDSLDIINSRLILHILQHLPGDLLRLA
jgi:hypothetical protein